MRQSITFGECKMRSVHGRWGDMRSGNSSIVRDNMNMVPLWQKVFYRWAHILLVRNPKVGPEVNGGSMRVLFAGKVLDSQRSPHAWSPRYCTWEIQIYTNNAENPVQSSQTAVGFSLACRLHSHPLLTPYPLPLGCLHCTPNKAPSPHFF